MRFQALDADIVRQRQAIKESQGKGAPFIAASTVLRLLEQEQSAIVEELGYNPRTN
jgi:hypothetical protein